MTPRNQAAVRRLRRRKRREEKPLAVMFPRLDAVREACEFILASQGHLEQLEGDYR